MSDSDEEIQKGKESAGAPAWVMTFADLMSLLMCFFVLLLAFSEMDVQKYKQLSGSMKQAFGVQREVRAHQIPKGTSVVSKEFSPGKPEPTLLNRVRQNTVDKNRKFLGTPTIEQTRAKKSTEADARKIAQVLAEEIKSGKVELETEDRKIIIRILERGSFPSGLAKMNKEFMPVMKKISTVVHSVGGKIRVSGHTDDVPISTVRFRSNWELSAARAVSVTHALLENGVINSKRFSIIGFADTQPRVPNDTPENRSKNRRVDIVIEQGEDHKPKRLLTIDSNKQNNGKPKPKSKVKAKN